MMKEIKKAILRSADAKEVQHEYKVLLSLGVDEITAEENIIGCFLSLQSERLLEGTLWLALALTQWELGRLSARVKAKANYWLSENRLPLTSSERRTLAFVLNGEQPVPKKIRKAIARKCPWKLGDVLAYRIISNSDLCDNVYWGKYVLLRVNAIPKRPVSSLAPELMVKESMVVALYSWVGDSIPDWNILQTLEFTPICVRGPLMDDIAKQHLLKNTPHEKLTRITSVIGVLTSGVEEYEYELDWGTRQEQTTVFTCIGNDEAYAKGCPAERAFSPQYSRAIAGLCAFDITLTKRLASLFGESQ